MAVVYLLHFERPISDRHTCQHYIGFANHLEQRIDYHRQGRSKARLLEVAHERGIGFVVARVWENGSKELERKLKNQKNSPELCPICREKRKQQTVQTVSDTAPQSVYNTSHPASLLVAI